MVEPWVYVLLVFASFRVVRFVVFDSLMGSHLESGTKWSRRLDLWAFKEDGSDNGWWRGKVGTLLSCVWCVGAYASLLVVGLWAWEWPVWWTAKVWLSWLAVWAGQCMVSVASHKWIET